MISLNSGYNGNKNHTLNSFMLSILVVLCLMIVAKPSFLQWFHPEWVVLFVVYWSIQNNSPLNLTLVFFIGLLVDLLLATPLGDHALIYCLICFIANRVQKQVAQLPLWQKTIFMSAILALLLIYQLIVSSSLGMTISLLSLTATALTSLFAWPVMYYYLDRSHRSSF